MVEEGNVAELNLRVTKKVEEDCKRTNSWHSFANLAGFKLVRAPLETKFQVQRSFEDGLKIRRDVFAPVLKKFKTEEQSEDYAGCARYSSFEKFIKIEGHESRSLLRVPRVSQKFIKLDHQRRMYSFRRYTPRLRAVLLLNSLVNAPLLLPAERTRSDRAYVPAAAA